MSFVVLNCLVVDLIDAEITACSPFRPRAASRRGAPRRRNPHIAVIYIGRTPEFVKVPQPEKVEVLTGFASDKGEVTEGYLARF